MEKFSIDKIFTYYDQFIAGFSPLQQAAISFLLLVLLIWQIWMVIKSGHWIFIALLVLLLPGTWPAAKKIIDFIWLLIKFLITRAQLLFS